MTALAQPTRSRPRLLSLPSARTSKVLAGAISFVLLLLLWQFVGSLGLLRSIPPITAVAETIFARSDLLLRSTAATGMQALIGGSIGYFGGILIAALAAVVPKIESGLLRIVITINSIPIIALGPILMTVGDRSTIPYVFAAMAVLFTTTVTAIAGFGSATRSSLDMMRVFGAKRRHVLLRLRLPSALPSFADALRLGVPAAVLGSVLGEWFGADTGLGVLMVSAMRNIQYELLWAAAVASVVISFLAYSLATGLEAVMSGVFGRSDTIQSSAAGQAGKGRRGGGAVFLGVVAAVVVAAWALWVNLADIPLLVAPSPLDVLGAFLGAPLEFISASGVTIGIAFGGMALGALLGAALAMVVEFAKPIRQLVSPLAVLVPTIPIVVLIPVLGGIFGYGVLTVFAACTLMAFFPFFTLLLSGLAVRPPGSADLFRVYRTGRFRTLLRLSVPASVPSLLLACELAAANCFLTALTAEWLMGQGGIGRLLSEKRALLDTAGSWTAVVFAMVLAIMTYSAVAALKRWLSPKWS